MFLGGGESLGRVARLISIYLKGEDNLTKNVPATTESTINVNIKRPDDGNVLIARRISDI